MGTKCGPEWPLGGCVTSGEPGLFLCCGFLTCPVRINQSTSLVGPLGRRDRLSVAGTEHRSAVLKVWSGYSCGSPRSFQGVCKVTTLFKKILSC